MSARVSRAGLGVAAPIAQFVEDEALPGSGIDAAEFWLALRDIMRDFAPRNRQLLDVRDDLQAKIDDYHRSHPGVPDGRHYRAFLTGIGYLRPQPEGFTISTTGVDDEIRSQAAPQLVVPLSNARFAVNAANARWGSLYDALYGSDAIAEAGELARSGQYNPVRGREVIACGRRLLDEAAPLTFGSHADAVAYRIAGSQLVVELADGTTTGLVTPATFVASAGENARPSNILLKHNGLHIEVQIDRGSVVGATDRAGIHDLLLESAVTTIVDLEDSVAAVDADDKALGYHNWRELMLGGLTAEVSKNGTTFTRVPNADRVYTRPGGTSLVLPGRSLLLVRNVGLHMYTDAVLDEHGEETPEGILDAVLTALGALPDLRGEHRGANSRTGSIYIVKPKLHGPEEVAFTVDLFARIEALLEVPARTIKIGIMDEERRTTLNLAACIAAAGDRVAFINTGFLDRTGDEIHTSFWAGAFAPKAQLRTLPFLQAYENANVGTGLRAGFGGRAQIGKGMWAMPDRMHDMLEQKIAQVRSGATTAWVPSPTAATLHALHYHRVDAFDAQKEVAKRPPQTDTPILYLPLDAVPNRPHDAVLAELDNNVQSILGYVVRWVDQGIGCSKVPDIHDVGLMEDRATLRISSQLLANWLAHDVITIDEVQRSLERLAPIVDAQNAGDPAYEPLVGPAGGSLAFETARQLILDGAEQPNGYTEPILHRARRAKKASAAQPL